MANCSSVDRQGAFLGEPRDHRHIDYFQSLEKFREAGLPCELPIRIEKTLRHDPRLCHLQSEVDRLEREEGQTSPAVEATREVERFRKTLKRTTLYRYQREWVKDRRKWKILSRGREQPSDDDKADLAQCLFLLIPRPSRSSHG